jgi:hypothetical protein
MPDVLLSDRPPSDAAPSRAGAVDEAVFILIERAYSSLNETENKA